MGEPDPSSLAGGVHRSGEPQGVPLYLFVRREDEEGALGPCPSLRAARLGKDLSGQDHRPGVGGSDPVSLRPLSGEARGHRLPANLSWREGPGLHRRGPPSSRGGRGGPLFGHGGLLPRHSRRPRNGGQERPSPPSPFHPGWGHDENRSSHTTPLKPFRHPSPPGLLPREGAYRSGQKERRASADQTLRRSCRSHREPLPRNTQEGEHAPQEVEGCRRGQGQDGRGRRDRRRGLLPFGRGPCGVGPSGPQDSPDPDREV